VKQKYRNNEPQYGLPELATVKNVTIDLPPVNGVSRKDTVPNPMYQFTNPEKDSNGSPAIMGDKTVMKTMTLGDIEHPSEDPKDPKRGQSVYPVCPDLPTKPKHDTAFCTALVVSERRLEW
jgi:hypothetical protein